MEAYLLAVLITALAYVLLTLGLNFQYGFTGLINFGYVSFFALGAYASAICTVRMGWPAWSVRLVFGVLGERRVADEPSASLEAESIGRYRHLAARPHTR